MTQSQPSQPSQQPRAQQKRHRVTLTFDHPLTDEELKKLQLTTDALEAALEDGHHDHDHPTLE